MYFLQSREFSLSIPTPTPAPAPVLGDTRDAPGRRVMPPTMSRQPLNQRTAGLYMEILLTGIPLLENKKCFLLLDFLVKKCVMFSKDIWYILPDFHFMIFDSYEIHIQAFVDLF